MTARASPKATSGTKRRTKKVTPEPAIELTEDMRRRFEELARRGVVDDICPACQSAQGLPKILRDGKTQWICAPCVLALHHHKYTSDLFKWRLIRLPYYRDWLNNTQEVADYLLALSKKGE